MTIHPNTQELNGASVTPANKVPHSSGQDHVPSTSPPPTTLRTAVADYHQSQSNWDSAFRDCQPDDLPDEAQTELSEGTNKAIGNVIASNATDHDELTLKMSILVDMMSTGLDDFPDGGHGQKDLAKSIFADMQCIQDVRSQTSTDSKESWSNAHPALDGSPVVSSEVEHQAQDILTIAVSLLDLDTREDENVAAHKSVLIDTLLERAKKLELLIHGESAVIPDAKQKALRQQATVCGSIKPELDEANIVTDIETTTRLREKVDRDASDIEAISKLLIAADGDPDLIPSTMFLHDALHEKATRMSSALDKLQLQDPHQHA